VGKTAVAVEVCRRVGGEIVSIDSRQVYRGIEIAINAPTRHELGGVRCHLVSSLDPRTRVTAHLYQQMATAAIVDVRSRGAVPVLTAGTGMYLKALVEGLDLGGLTPDPAGRRNLETQAAADLRGLVSRLQALEPAAAARVDVHNARRVVRAMELAMARRAGSAEDASRTAVPAIKVGLEAPRVELYRRIESRTDHMLARGWRREVERLLARGIDPTAQAFSGIGVREMAEVVRGGMTVEDARGAIVQKTRNYAKRQLTWFRADPEVAWLDVTLQSASDIVERLVGLIRKR
jgi:tRNA dimethylallyltransferase